MNWEARLKRQKAKKLYSSFIRNGSYEEAWLLLKLLRCGRITLGLWDADWNVERALEKAGFSLWYSRNGNHAKASI